MMPILFGRIIKRLKIKKEKKRREKRLLQKGFLIMKMSILINFDINAGIEGISAQ